MTTVILVQAMKKVLTISTIVYDGKKYKINIGLYSIITYFGPDRRYVISNFSISKMTNASHDILDLNTTTSVSNVEAEANYWALILLVFPVFTALGNLLVILSVFTEKALQTSTNYLIVSLAVADFLVAILVMPWGIYVLASSKFTQCHNIKQSFSVH